MASLHRRYASGVTCVHTGDGGTQSLAARLAAAIGADDHAFALVYYSHAALSDEAVVALMARACPGLHYAACSTAGEITPAGITEREALVLLFPRDRFRVSASLIGPAGETGIEGIVAQVAGAKRDFLAGSPEAPASRFALTLMDGLSFMEEMLTAAIHWGLHDIPLLGGSAGDDLDFHHTSLILDGRIGGGSALMVLFETVLPIHIFKTENFVPTADKLVVTRSDPERRVVHELNARPAAQVYAEVIGTDPAALTPQSFASHPLVVRVGGQYYCRSIQKVNPDGSLTFFCAIDDGIVLTVAEPAGMARTTLDAFEAVRTALGEIDFVLGFDCVLRRIDARNRQVTQQLAAIYRDHNVVGFNTYGEQFASMHLNQTFSGVAFGHAGQALPCA